MLGIYATEQAFPFSIKSPTANEAQHVRLRLPALWGTSSSFKWEHWLEIHIPFTLLSVWYVCGGWKKDTVNNFPRTIAWKWLCLGQTRSCVHSKFALSLCSSVMLLNIFSVSLPHLSYGLHAPLCGSVLFGNRNVFSQRTEWNPVIYSKTGGNKWHSAKWSKLDAERQTPHVLYHIGNLKFNLNVEQGPPEGRTCSGVVPTSLTHAINMSAN